MQINLCKINKNSIVTNSYENYIVNNLLINNKSNVEGTN
jgi:hypothetical protein